MVQIVLKAVLRGPSLSMTSVRNALMTASDASQLISVMNAKPLLSSFKINALPLVQSAHLLMSQLL